MLLTPGSAGGLDEALKMLKPLFQGKHSNPVYSALLDSTLFRLLRRHTCNCQPLPGRLVPQALQKRPLRVLPLLAPVQIDCLDGCCWLAAETLKGCLKGKDCVHIRQLQTITAGLPFPLAIPAAVAQAIACAVCRGNCKSC